MEQNRKETDRRNIIMIRRLAGCIGEYKRDTILTPAFVILEALMEVLIPFLMSKMIDEGVMKGNMKLVWLIGIGMLAAAALSMAGGILAGRTAATASAGFAKNVRKAMYYNIQDFSFANIDKYSTAGLITRLTTDVTNVQNAYQMIIRMLVRSPIMLVLAMGMCFYINGKMALIFLGAIIFLGGTLYFIATKSFSPFDKLFKRYDAMNSQTQENLTGIRVVKAYVREGHETEKFHKASGEIYHFSKAAEKIIIWNNPIMMFTMYSCILLISWLGARLIVSNTMTTGELMSLFTYTMNILMSLMMISMVFVMLTMARSSAERIVELLDEKSSLTNTENPVYTVKDGSICFEQVDFGYQGKKDNLNLEGVNLTIASGETVGIIGGTGSAKSTLVQLIPRLYDVTGGCIKVGGKDVRCYDIETLRNEVAMVLQKNILFSGTVKENLRWGNKGADEEEMLEACRLAQADEFIQKFPDKYDTYIEQGGSNVSGGQKQRLCIARALLKKPKILILDDSTSAVDTRTDALIREAFREKIPDTTKIIIAQRIASVEDADQIIVLDDGKINAVGTHKELLKKNHIYREIYESQVKGVGSHED